MGSHWSCAVRFCCAFSRRRNSETLGLRRRAHVTLRFMACQRCDHRGYIETLTARNGKYYPLILQCNYCRDMEAYMTRVKYMLEMQELVHKAKNAKPEK